MTTRISRRGFLQSATATALIVGFDATGALAQSPVSSGHLTPFVKIFPDGRVVAIIKHFEGGQGTATGLSALVAEELNMRLQDISFEMAPSDNDRYANLHFGAQATGGSSSMANSYLQYRTAAAAARELLLAAAADSWGVSAKTLSLRDGIISGGGKSASIGVFAEAAAKMRIPDQPRLKDPADWRVLGVDQKARLDTPDKIDGTARFSMDIQLDNQMVVAIKRTPRFGGVVASFDDSAARQVPGFIMAVQMPNNVGVMAFAETTWAAFQARDSLTVEWDFSSAERRSSGAIEDELLAMVRAAPEFQATGTDLATANAELKKRRSDRRGGVLFSDARPCADGTDGRHA